MHLLVTPTLNKGTAFTEKERDRFGLHGLLPTHIESLKSQVARAYVAYQRKPDDLERHIYLRALQDTNEVLFYRLLFEHMEEMTPIIYTPTVALGCQQFSNIYRRPRGLFVSYPQRGSIRRVLRNRPNKEVDVIVVTDGERILGIGDQGIGGLGIPIGKLSLYTLFGGIHPSRTLPIVLDVGTNNPERLQDPRYLGWAHERITGDEYFDFVEQFVRAVRAELPRACLQWEDFATPHARPILQRYRDRLLTFNDDIQGTAAVALGALMAAVKATKKRLRDQAILFFGAGAAATGVADFLREEMVAEGATPSEARARFWMVNRGGLLHERRTDLSPEQRVYAQPWKRVAGWASKEGITGLKAVVANIDAGILIGLSTVGGAFTEEIIREMARKVERPIIFPLSNPTDRAEARPEDLMRWTEGKALIATGSPFAAFEIAGKRLRTSQCNNVYIFPGLGLGVVASKARRITDAMLITAARTLSRFSPALREPSAPLLPPLTSLREISVKIACAVGEEAMAAGLAPKCSEGELNKRIRQTQWMPDYT